MIECSDTLNGSESILGKKFSKSNFLTFSLEGALHIKYLSFCLSDDALFLFSKIGYLLLCVESLPLTTTLSPVVSPTSLAYPRMAILWLLPNFICVSLVRNPGTESKTKLEGNLLAGICVSV